jgi:alkane 1-monooxygenase
MRDLKYLAAYTMPAILAFSLYMGASYYWCTFAFAFLILPIIETILPLQVENFSIEQEVSRTRNRFFDVLLYLNLPIVFGLLLWFAQVVTTQSMTVWQSIGLVLSTGVLLGVNGINVAHELGHRESLFERTLSVLLLLPSHYMQFFIEHNLGHHKYVATKQDPATARLNEPIFFFIPRAVFGVYTKAWAIEADILKKDGKSFWSGANRMLWFTAIQFAYYGVVAYFFGINGMFFLIAAGIVGFMLLETINYVEHYGLMRQTMASGRPEPVSPRHSWNSDHQMGRIILYELTRHSDHHFKATRPYQILRHMDESPQLPYGYPTSVVLAWFTPIWFRVMNKRALPFRPVELQEMTRAS